MTATMLRAPAGWALIPPPSLEGVDLRRAEAWTHVDFTNGQMHCRPVFIVQTRSGALARLLAPRPPRGPGAPSTLEMLRYRDDRRGD